MRAASDKRGAPPVTAEGAKIEVRRVLIVANPAARGYAQTRLDAIVAALAGADVYVEIRRSMQKGDVCATVAAIGAGFDVVAVHGGDGTINEAVAGLRAIEDHAPALAIIAGGTVNVLARETGARFAASEVAGDIMSGLAAPLHYGLANGQPFVLMASAGLDAAVVHRVSPDLKRAIGKWAYIWAALVQKRHGRGPDVLATVDGVTHACRIAICANAARYGGDFIVAPQTSALRSGLQLVLVKDDSLAGLLRIGWRLLCGRDLAGAGVVSLAAAEVEVSASAGVAAAQIDGDPFGATPLRVQAATRPLLLITGRSA